MKGIKLDNIFFGYKKDELIFKNLSLELSSYEADGRVIAVMGESGSGKTTLFKLMLGIELSASGTISTIPTNPVIAYLPQEPVLFEHLSPLENARYFATSQSYKTRFSEELFSELQEDLNLKTVLERSKTVLQISGGQRQRLGLLQALSIRPDFLFLDEPTTGLDAEVKLQFLGKLKELTSKYQLLVIYITHHKAEAELIADDIIYLPKSTYGGTSNVYQDTISNFSFVPPLLEAINVFKYPTPNLIRINNTEGVFVLSNDNSSNYVAYIDYKSIHFSETDGYEFSIKSSNNVYSVIDLVQYNQTIFIHADLLAKIIKKYIYFKGKIPIYENGRLLSADPNMLIYK